MNGMMIYFDDLRAVQRLTDEQLGQLVRLLAYYAESGEPASSDDLAVTVAYGMMAQKIDRDREKYDRIVERNRENGRKGGRPPGSKENPVGYLGFPKNPKKLNVTVDVNEDVAVDVTDTVYQPFDRFWTAYPKKVAKAAARKAWDKLKPSEELTETILAAIEAQKSCEQWKKKQFIPNPATWLNGRRWEDEIIQPSVYNPWLDALRGDQS